MPKDNFIYKTKPMEHQREMLKFHFERTSSMDNSEQGTGKTKVAIDLIVNRIKKDNIKRALVVCPALIIYTWAKEIEKHSDLKYKILSGSDRTYTLKKNLDNCEIFIVSYNSLHTNNRQFLKALLQAEFKQVIFDEIHFSKNFKANRTKACIALADKIPFRLGISATPIENPEDVWGIFRLIDRGSTFFDNFYRFRAKYFIKYKLPTFIKYQPRNELWYHIRRALRRYSIRFLKEDCLDLPEKIYKELLLPMAKNQAIAYFQLSKTLRLEDFRFSLPPAKITLYEKLNQITSGFLYGNDKIIEFDNPKAELLKLLVPELTKKDKKTIIVSKYQYEIDYYTNLLQKYHPLQINGSISNKEAIANKFQNDSRHKVLLLQSDCGVGITLTAADSMIFTSNSYSYTSRYQAEDRCHRITQHRPVVYYDLILMNTIDERILQILKRKRKMAYRLLDENKRRKRDGSM